MTSRSCSRKFAVTARVGAAALIVVIMFRRTAIRDWRTERKLQEDAAHLIELIRFADRLSPLLSSAPT